MKRLAFIILIFLVSRTAAGQKLDSIKVRYGLPPIATESRSTAAKFGLSLLEGQLYNFSFYAFDRYVLNAEYAQVSLETIRRNMAFGTGWDHDVVAINMIGHPVQGGIAHIINRLNGLGFWQSLPLVFVESASWEFFAETEPPSPNDFFTTTWNGLVLGEAAWRAFNYAFDKESRKDVDFKMRAGLGTRIVGELSNSIPHPSHNPAVGIGASATLDITYGDKLHVKDNAPVNYFDLHLTAALGNGQSPVSEFTFLGRLWGKELSCEKGEALFGIFDHMSTFLSESWTDCRAPYRCSEAASVGPGFVYSRNRFTSGTYLSATVIGAGTTDYYSIYDRDYNFGSGYSIKSLNSFKFGDRFTLDAGIRHYQIFTIFGDKTTEVADKHYINSQGDNGTTITDVYNLKATVKAFDYLEIEAGGFLIRRNSIYDIHPSSCATHCTAEFGLRYCL